jgi:hypothetical protein
MALPGPISQANGKAPTETTPPTGRAPRRLVLLSGAADSAVERILAEFPGEDARKAHQQIQQAAAEHPGKVVAVEWLGPFGWTRFLWCGK